MTYLSPTALRNLKPYAYSFIDESLASRYILDPYRNWLLTLLPQTMAPNILTLLGFITVVLNILTLLIYDPLYCTDKDGPNSPPQWVYFTWALGVFMYQTFDGLDGRHARRTGTSNALGELFDHGCDALNTTLEVILSCRALNLGRSWWTVTSHVTTLATFYTIIWEQHHTGIMYFGPISSVEGGLVLALIYIISGVFGPSFWDQRLLTLARLDHIPQVVEILPDIGLNEALIAFAASLLAFNIASSYQNVYKAMRATGRSPLKPLVFIIPFVPSAVLQVLWLLHPSIHHSNIIHSPLFLPVMGAWGLQFAHHAGRVILSRVTKTSFPWWNSMWIWSTIGVLDAHLPNILNRSPVIQSTLERTTTFVYLTLAISFFGYARFYILVTREITEYLGIEYFTVHKKNTE